MNEHKEEFQILKSEGDRYILQKWLDDLPQAEFKVVIINSNIIETVTVNTYCLALNWFFGACEE